MPIDEQVERGAGLFEQPPEDRLHHQQEDRHQQPPARCGIELQAGIGDQADAHGKAAGAQQIADRRGAGEQGEHRRREGQGAGVKPIFAPDAEQRARQPVRIGRLALALQQWPAHDEDDDA